MPTIAHPTYTLPADNSDDYSAMTMAATNFVFAINKAATAVVTMREFLYRLSLLDHETRERLVRAYMQTYAEERANADRYVAEFVALLTKP